MEHGPAMMTSRGSTPLMASATASRVLEMTLEARSPSGISTSRIAGGIRGRTCVMRRSSVCRSMMAKRLPHLGGATFASTIAARYGFALWTAAGITVGCAGLIAAAPAGQSRTAVLEVRVADTSGGRGPDGHGDIPAPATNPVRSGVTDPDGTLDVAGAP